MTTRTYFCLAFWWRRQHATTTLLLLKWTFCLCVFNVSSKTAGQRQGQLSHGTAATIVCMFAYTCVHGPSAPRCKLCGWNVCCVLIWGNLDRRAPADIWKCLECQLFMLAFDMWVSGTEDLPKDIACKYWHQADDLLHNLNFSVAHFPLLHDHCDVLLAYIFPNLKNDKLNVCWQFMKHDQQLSLNVL